MIPPGHVHVLAALLFALGVVGFLRQRNAILLLMSVELMLNSAILTFLAGSAEHGSVDGVVGPLFLLVVAAAEAAVGLALILVLYRKTRTTDVEVARRMKD